MVITTVRLHSTKPELRFCAGSKPARGLSEICDGEDLWRWSRLEIRLNAFRRSTIPQKQFFIIIIISSSSSSSLCNPGIFIIQGIFKRLSNIYHGIFYLKFCVTLKSKHIQNPVEYLTWDILRTLPNYVYIANLDTQYIQSFPILRTQVCQLLMYQLIFRTINLLLHPLLFFREWAITTLFLTMGYFLPIVFLATS